MFVRLIPVIITICISSAIQGMGASTYLYIIKFENLNQEESISWLGQGFVDMLYSKFNDSGKLRLKNKDDLENIMNNRSLLLHQPRGSRNFLLLGKYERKLDKVEINLQLVDIATWEETDRRQIHGDYENISKLNRDLTTVVETMLMAFIQTEKKKKSIYPEFTVEVPEATKSNLFDDSKEVSNNIDLAIEKLEKSMDLVIGAQGSSAKDDVIKKGEEWILDLGKNSHHGNNPKNDANTHMLINVLNNLMDSPYNIKIQKPTFEYNIENRKMMNVKINVVYSLKEHVIADMLKSLPYTGLKQDGSLMIMSFNKEKFNFSESITEKIRFGKYRAVPVISFLNEDNNLAVLIVDSPEAAIHKLKSNRVHFVSEHRFSPLIDFTIGGWQMHVAMESVEIPVTYSFTLPTKSADSIRRISLKFVSESELSAYLQSLL